MFHHTNTTTTFFHDQLRSVREDEPNSFVRLFLCFFFVLEFFCFVWVFFLLTLCLLAKVKAHGSCINW